MGCSEVLVLRKVMMRKTMEEMLRSAMNDPAYDHQISTELI